MNEEKQESLRGRIGKATIADVGVTVEIEGEIPNRGCGSPDCCQRFGRVRLVNQLQLPHGDLILQDSHALTCIGRIELNPIPPERQTLVETAPQCVHLSSSPHGPAHGPSVWETDRWARRPSNDHGGKPFEFWNEEAWGPPPHTCSFCGGVRPEDVLRLMAAGWEIAATTKSYKRYMNPPGHHLHMQELLGHVKNQIVESAPPFEGPRPPLKVYTYHFTEDDSDAFNAALDKQEEDAEAE